MYVYGGKGIVALLLLGLKFEHSHTQKTEKSHLAMIRHRLAAFQCFESTLNG
jgi:hypothetical protein